MGRKMDLFEELEGLGAVSPEEKALQEKIAAAKAALQTVNTDYEWIKSIGPLTGGG